MFHTTNVKKNWGIPIKLHLRVCLTQRLMDGHHSTDVTNHNQANITVPRGYPTVLLPILWVFCLRDKYDASVEREPASLRNSFKLISSERNDRKRN